MPVLPWTGNLFWRTLRQKGYWARTCHPGPWTENGGGGLLSRVGTKDEDSRCTGEHRVKMGWAQGEATAEAEKVKAGSPDQETHKTLPMGG